MKKDGNKILLLNAKSQQLFTKKYFLFFSIFLRFYAAIINKFRSTTSYLCSKCTTKTYEIKYFSLDNDAETHSSNKEENEKRDFFFIQVLVKQQRENTDKHKTKKNKFWIKAQITKNQSKNTQ
jgi:hypothetical protein